jgi:DNA-directed RNA polymerase specialized sigma24 family protein
MSRSNHRDAARTIRNDNRSSIRVEDGHRSAAEDMVQDICLDALEGQLRLPIDPGVALEALLHEIAERCEEREESSEGDDR